MRTIPLTQGQSALVDDNDYELLMQGPKWRAHKDTTSSRILWYAVRSIRDASKAKGETSQMMHVFLMGTTGVDHINHNGLDNRRENLRLATLSQSKANQRIYANNSSGLKGVVWEKEYVRSDTGKLRPGGWVARITTPDGKHKRLGRFATKEQAAEAYDNAAREYFGEYACVNYPREGEQSAL